jgi:hypothetical protein
MGQTRFRQILTNLNIPFHPEKVFHGCLWRFDFELTDLKILIEFDGQQHFKTGLWRPTLEDLEDGQQRDRDKLELALENGYRMIRFDYTWAVKEEELIEDAIWHTLEIMENDNIVLVVSNPNMYYWLQTDIAFEPQIANMGKELFSAFTLHVWD